MRSPCAVLLPAAVVFLAAVATCPKTSNADDHVPPAPPAASQNFAGVPISLEQAIARAIDMNPAFAAVSHAVSAAEARVVQAGLLPNPELAFEFENFGGGGEFDGFSAAESTVVISQPILLGGKRLRRRAVAESEHLLAGRDLEALRLDVIAATSSAFYRVLAAQKRQSLAEELLALAERSAGTVQMRVDAGKVSPVDATRAGIEVAQARIRLSRTRRELQAARIVLAETWGASAAFFDRVAGELPTPVDPPDLASLKGRLMDAPEMTRLEQQVERQKRCLELEQSYRVPDLIVSVGPRRFEESDQTTWVAGLSLPIPLFNRNQGARKAAQFELERRRREAESVRVGLEAELAATLERLHAAAAEAAMVGSEVVPAARAAFVATEVGYREGKFGFLDVLDAQRSLFEVRSLDLDSREEYAVTLNEIERLIGGRLQVTTIERTAVDVPRGDDR